MRQTITITPKWQIYLPEQIRKKAGITYAGKLNISISNKTIILKPEKSKVLALAAKYRDIKPKKPINIDKIRNYIDYSDL